MKKKGDRTVRLEIIYSAMISCVHIPTENDVSAPVPCRIKEAREFRFKY